MQATTDRITLPLTLGQTAIIDAEDFERECYVEFRNGKVWTGRVCDKKWSAEQNYRCFYAHCRIIGIGQVYLHRLVMSAGRGQLVDHRDRIGTNCWKSNLRVSDATTNSQNRRPIAGKRFKGVRLHKQNRNWIAAITVNKETIHLGVFATEEEAARAYDAAAIRHFGEFAYLNFPLVESQAK